MDDKKPRQIRDPVPLHKGTSSPTRFVVERDRNRNCDGRVTDSDEIALGVISLAAPESSSVPSDKFVDNPEPGVVPRLGVLISGVSKTDHQEVGWRP